MLDHIIKHAIIHAAQWIGEQIDESNKKASKNNNQKTQKKK